MKIIKILTVCFSVLFMMSIMAIAAPVNASQVYPVGGQTITRGNSPETMWYHHHHHHHHHGGIVIHL
jgi:hypothetical protein